MKINENHPNFTPKEDEGTDDENRFYDYMRNGDETVDVAWLLACRAFGIAQANEMFP